MLCLVAQSCPTLYNPTDCSPPGSSVHGDSPGKNTGVSCHGLLQRIFPTQGLNQVSPPAGRFFTILLAVYFTFILDYGNDVRQKVIFLFEFKMGCKVAETTFNISNAFGPETANKCTVQFNNVFQDESLEDEVGSGWPLDVDNHREHHQNWSSGNYTRTCLRKCRAFDGHQAFEANWKGEKTWWYVGASWADRKCFKTSFWAVLRWRRNRMGRPLSPPQIHWKNIWTPSKFHRTTCKCWQRTSGTQKGSPLSSKGGRTKYKQ